MALHSVHVKDNYAHIHNVLGHMSREHILWHREFSKNAHFTDATANILRPICTVCAYGESRQTGTDHHQGHRPLPTQPGQCFVIDAFSSTTTSVRGYRYCDLMRDGASQMIYTNFTETRSADDITSALERTWDLNPDWRIYDPHKPDVFNPRFIRMDPEQAYKSEKV